MMKVYYCPVKLIVVKLLNILLLEKMLYPVKSLPTKLVTQTKKFQPKIAATTIPCNKQLTNHAYNKN
jgi:hypothetical protein